MQATFGPLIFDLSTRSYEDLHRSSKYRWPVMDRLGVRPARQWIGIGDDTICLRGTVYPLFEGGQGGGVVGCGQIEEVRAVAETGIPYNFVDGNGKVYGMYVIEDVRETGKIFFSNGLPRKQEFEVDLGRYGEDDLGSQGMILLAGEPTTPRSGVGTGLDGNTGAGIGVA